ncbi:type IV pilus assembly protein PilY1 [Gammaproteobacteria bacterium]
MNSISITRRLVASNLDGKISLIQWMLNGLLVFVLIGYFSTAQAAVNISLSISPTSLSVAKGASGTIAITVTPSGGFNSNVALSVSGLPAGTTATFSPTSIAGGNGASTLTLVVGSSTVTGSYTVTVTASGGGKTKTSNITLTVTGGDFAITTSSSTLTVAKGVSGTATITVTPSGGFNSSIALTASGLPSGTTASFNPTSIATGSGSSTLTLAVGSSTATGNSTVTVTGTGGGKTHTVTITLTVINIDFTITATPSSPTAITVAKGGSGTAVISTALVGGFNSAVALSVTAGLPSGTTATFNPTSIPAPGAGSSTLTLSVGTSTVVNTYTLTITGSGGGISRTTTVTLTVLNGDFTISALFSDLTTSTTIAQGTADTANVTVIPSGGFNSSVAITTSGLPSGVTATPSPSSIATGSGTSALTLSANSSATTGTYTVTITGTSGSLIHTTTITLGVVSANGGWNYFYYTHASADDLYTNSCGSTLGAAAESCNVLSPFSTDWRILSSAINILYYNPAVTYSPWPGFANASFSAARSNPQSGQAGYTSTRNLAGIIYEVAVDDSGFSGTRPRRGTNTNRTVGANGLIDLWDTHTRYTVNSSSVAVAAYSYNNITSSGSNVSLNPTVTTSTLSTAGTCDTDLGGGSVSCRTIAAAQQNIANWYQYYRRRSFVARAAIANVITGAPNYRYGLSVINQWTGTGSLFVEMPAASVTDYTSQNSTLLTSLYNFVWAPNGTPLLAGLDRVGKYYKGGTLTGHTTSPITSQCQQNFTILLTDGYWNDSSAPSGIGDVDADGVTGSLSDVARYYYNNDLSSGFANNVPTTTFDTATWQHMVTFGVAFGVQGNLVDTDGDGWPNPILSENSYWGNPQSTTCTGNSGECPDRIDDLWHAGYDSRGDFASAQTPQAVQQAVSSALASIASRTATSAAIATNSTRLDTGTLIYQAQFNSADWSGRLLAYKVNADGTIYDPNHNGNIIEDAQWDTNNTGTFPTSANRNIYTWNGTAGTVFDVTNWGNLSTSQKTALQNGGTIADGQDRLNWMRGDQSNEQPNGALRTRTKLLGDIVNSNPVFVGVTNFGYDDMASGVTGQDSYAAFVTASQSRAKVLYVGANDGMLHAFDAATGVEKFAFIPSTVFSNLQGSSTLTNPSYVHKYLLDGSPQVGDAYFLGSASTDPSDPANWRTILVGSSGAGAKSIFALDVTDPDNFNQSNVLWEFTDTDLGYPVAQFVQPVIGRMQDGSWAVVFGNGYQSTNYHAVLYVVNLQTGALIKKIDTGVGSSTSQNGLVGPVILADNQRTMKYAYAGDLLGNLWKFDLSNASAANWTVAFKNGTTPKPLFQAHYISTNPVTDVVQPISSPPEIGLHPNGGYIVVFGTGKYFETGDNTSTAVQSLYGIWDKDDGTTACAALADACVFPTNRSTLQVQTILTEPSSNGSTWRVISSNAIDWSTQRGWYVDLLQPPSATAQGERVINVPILNNGRAIFTTLVPSSNACSGGGSSWIMEVDMLSGGRISTSVFDVNQDSQFDNSDFVNNTPVSGVQSSVGIINTPSIISAGQVEYKFAGGSTGNIMSVKEVGDLTAGRQSWRQFR